MAQADYPAGAILECAMDIGAALLQNGAEVYRVEDSIGRICRAYGAARVDAFAIPSSIVVTLHDADGLAYTQTRRIRQTATDLDKVARLNQLSRDICAAPPPPPAVARYLSDIAGRRSHGTGLRLLAYAAIAASLAIFFGGSPGDSAAAACVGGVLLAIQAALQRLKAGPSFATLMCSAAVAAGALACVRMGLGSNVDKIIIGNVMLLIPGLELTNGIRDLISGDFLAGLLHLAESIVLAVLIGIGAAGTLALLGGAA